MLGRAPLLAVLTILGAVFSGCISGDDAATEDVTVHNETVDNVIDANETTAAPDGRGDIAAFKETNKTEVGTGGMMHSHDYWKGETRKDIAYIDSGLIPFPLMPEGYPTGTAIADYDIPRGNLVYEGTAQLELMLVHKSAPFANWCPNALQGQCTPAVEHPNVHVNFDYLTAADEPGQFRKGGELQVGVPFVIPVAPTEADMPHQTKSLWIFRIYSSEPTWFEFNITVTAVKGNAIVEWPPHPNLYADKTERVIFEGDIVIEHRDTLEANLYGLDGNWQHPERVISYGTDRVEVEITNVQWAADVAVAPEPEKFVLEYHNASKPPLLGHGAQYGARLEDPSTDGSTYKFSIDLAGDYDALDSPYGDKSRWGFRFVPVFGDDTTCIDDEFLQQILVGCQFFKSKTSYHIKITAFGHSTEDGVKDAGLDEV